MVTPNKGIFFSLDQPDFGETTVIEKWSFIPLKQVESDLDSDDLEFEPFDYEEETDPKYTVHYIIEALGILDNSALEQNVSKTEAINRQIGALKSIPKLAQANSSQEKV